MKLKWSHKTSSEMDLHFMSQSNMLAITLSLESSPYLLIQLAKEDSFSIITFTPMHWRFPMQVPPIIPQHLSVDFNFI